MKYKEKIQLKIAKGVEVNEKGCWLWKGAKHRQGYGNISYKGRCCLAHRVSWEVFRGDLQENLKVCHTCDVPQCVNPYHLFLGTQKDNMHDAFDKGKYENRKMGKRRNKLSYNQVNEIKILYMKGAKQKELTKMFSVGQNCISKIVTCKSWNINWEKEF